MSHGRHPVRHVNEGHADDLLAVARAFGGHPDATSARADRIDRDGIDLVLDTPRGTARSRVNFAQPVADGDPNGAPAAFRELAGRARAALDASRVAPPA